MINGINYHMYKKGSSYSTAKRMVPELIPVLGSQPAGNSLDGFLKKASSNHQGAFWGKSGEPVFLT